MNKQILFTHFILFGITLFVKASTDVLEPGSSVEVELAASSLSNNGTSGPEPESPGDISDREPETGNGQ